MNPEDRFSHPSLVIFAGCAGFIAGALLLWLGSAFTGALPLPFGHALVRLPILMGGDFTFLLAWFAFWALVGLLLGIRLTRHRAPALSPALRAERTKPHGEKSFTLIELLIVIAIIAVLAVVVVLVLNPAQLLMQARDANRISDMQTLNQALTLYSEDVGSGMGSSSVVYVSVPDPTATTTAGTDCTGIGLASSSLPSGWTWHCAASSTYKNTDGRGWIPVNFRAQSFGSSLGTLPVDPVNQTSSGLYYTYVAQGDPWELTANMESEKYGMGGSHDVVSTDGGQYPDLYEVGSDLKLTPIDYDPSLVGYWKFDEGTGGVGAITFDSSGKGNNGTLGDASTTGVGPTWMTSGCREGNCLNFDGMDDYVSTNFLQSQVTAYTECAWVQMPTPAPAGINRLIIINDRGSGSGHSLTLYLYLQTTQTYYVDFGDDSNNILIGISTSNTVSGADWHFICGVFDGGGAVSPSQFSIYLDGATTSTTQMLTGSDAAPLSGLGGTNIGYSQSWTSSMYGLLDDVRIYNRALSASEIQAIYNAEK